MSPYNFNGNNANVFNVLSSGALIGTVVDVGCGVRPVINLKADTVFTGTGTSTDPFKVGGA